MTRPSSSHHILCHESLTLPAITRACWCCNTTPTQWHSPCAPCRTPRSPRHSSGAKSCVVMGRQSLLGSQTLPLKPTCLRLLLLTPAPTHPVDRAEPSSPHSILWRKVLCRDANDVKRDEEVVGAISCHARGPAHPARVEGRGEATWHGEGSSAE